MNALAPTHKAADIVFHVGRAAISGYQQLFTSFQMLIQAHYVGAHDTLLHMTTMTALISGISIKKSHPIVTGHLRASKNLSYHRATTGESTLFHYFLLRRR